ncbi:pirin family protein [Mucilaginibacter koreensis]
MEETVIHRANTRGSADLGWLQANPTFSFGHYYNRERMSFGALRVLNDDTIAGDKGFGDHPHDNMEIITIPLAGALTHRDNLGNVAVIRAGEIQVISAGTGLYHSEVNEDPTEPAQVLQIWVYPNQRNVAPRYEQRRLDVEARNVWHQILSPKAEDDGVWIYQDAWFSMGKFDAGLETTYTLHRSENGVYVFIISGQVTINGEVLKARDGMGLSGISDIQIAANSNAEVLLMEVPMTY